MTAIDPSPVQSPAAAAGAMKPSEALRKARELITSEGLWTQDHFARTVNDRAIGPLEDRAVCWCSAGALRKVSGDEQLVWLSAQRFFENVVGMDIVTFNDYQSRTHSQVLAAFDVAIIAAEAEGN